jgi:hypothetical protein
VGIFQRRKEGKQMSTSVKHPQKSVHSRKTAGSLKERVAVFGSPLASVLANLHYIMALLMKVMLLATAAGVMSATRDAPWIRRSLLLVALLAAGFTLSHMLSGKDTRWMLLLRGLSLLFTAGMITWSIVTFGF